MIGMSQIKKKLYTGILIGAGVGVVAVGLTLWWSIATIKSYEAGNNKKYNEQFTKQVCVLTKDVIQGQTITADMLSLVRVHIGTVPTGAVTAINSAADQVAKYNIAAYTPITNSMITTKILDKDIREQEVNTILMPSDLVEGQFVDIRVMFPNGTDYIVLAGKQVNKISGQTMWLSIKEDERLILNSAIVDSFLNEGTKLYATIYSDPEAQVRFEEKRDEIVKGQLATLIKAELPELSTIAGLDTTDITDTVIDEKTGKPVPVENPYIDKILAFILKYNNLTSATSEILATYQPNSEVITAMKGNINITNEATDKLSTEIRGNIETLNNQYEAANPEKITNVVTGAQTSISSQKDLRRELLGEE